MFAKRLLSGAAALAIAMTFTAHVDAAVAASTTAGVSAPLGAKLSAVSCPSSTICIAVGYAAESARVLAERWNGTSWKILPAPNPRGATSSSLNGVSCSSATACIAVGGDDKQADPLIAAAPLAERWNGTSWNVLPTPDPAQR